MKLLIGFCFNFFLSCPLGIIIAFPLLCDVLTAEEKALEDISLFTSLLQVLHC